MANNYLFMSKYNSKPAHLLNRYKEALCIILALAWFFLKLLSTVKNSFLKYSCLQNYLKYLNWILGKFISIPYFFLPNHSLKPVPKVWKTPPTLALLKMLKKKKKENIKIYGQQKNIFFKEAKYKRKNPWIRCNETTQRN